ncbi:hypothetical protein [Arthrobacter sp. H41]|uniref:hypothetical protein n=1 Tax=Arthrobacter sp. H41 TaxID=1312978 RepID=UPI0004793586|nr:hypothetical protein [Arthrobacter sp. H41]
MTPPQQHPLASRTEKLIAAKQADSRRKRGAVLRSIEHLAHSATPITVPAVARHARVSTWMIYNVPELKQAFLHAAEHQTLPAPRQTPPGHTPSIQSLTAERAHLAARLATATAERDRYRNIIKAGVGAQLEARTTDELTTRITDLENALARTRNQLQDTEQQLHLLHDELQDTRDQLRAAQRNNRLLIQHHNNVVALPTADTTPTG